MSVVPSPLFFDWIDTPLGAMLAVADQTHLHMLEFKDRDTRSADLAALERETASTAQRGRTPALEQIVAELEAYFAGRSGDFRIPLAYAGTAFERQVWAQLLEIPLGETCSYGDIARAIKAPTAFRAVAQANHVNRHCIVIPCHRCIGSDGSLTGYGGGLWRKQWLLRHEGKMRPVGLFAEART